MLQSLRTFGLVGIAMALGLLGAAVVGCTTQRPAADDCTADASVTCDPGAVGVSCAAGNTPAYVCSTPTTDPSSGNALYCCVTGTFPSGTCRADDSVMGCVAPAIGFSCAGAFTPEQTDPSLECAGGFPDPSNGQLDFCCCVGGSC